MRKRLIVASVSIAAFGALAIVILWHRGALEGTEGAPMLADDSIPYDLDAPNGTFVLPGTLAEVSGLTDVSDGSVACVQDEDGTIFVYDIDRRRVVRRIPFGGPGDYEGLTAVGGGYFVLRSDGLLYELTDPDDPSGVVTYDLDLPTGDNEGLAFDQERNRLLIAPKSRRGKGKEFKDSRAIFAFDLEGRSLSPEPALEISVAEVIGFAEARGLPLPMKERKKGARGKKARRAALKLFLSSLAVHPITDEFFLLSAVDGVLVSMDRGGTVTGYAMLDPSRFRQPEGITFMPNGDMLITNEGAGREPILLLFRWRGDEASRGGAEAGDDAQDRFRS